MAVAVAVVCVFCHYCCCRHCLPSELCRSPLISTTGCTQSFAAMMFIDVATAVTKHIMTICIIDIIAAIQQISKEIQLKNGNSHSTTNNCQDQTYYCAYVLIYIWKYIYTRVSVISNSKVLIVFLNNFYKGNKLFILPKLFYFSHVYFDWNYFLH